MREPAQSPARPYPVTMFVASRLLPTAVLIPAVALMGSCRSEDGPAVFETPRAAVLVASPGEGGDAALVTGTVAIVDGCLAIGNHVAIWPSGTRIADPDGPVVDVPGLGTVTVGDRVLGGGGYFQAEDHQGEPQPPDSCSEAGLVVYHPE